MGKLHEMAIRDVLKIPKEAKPGKYVLGWRWANCTRWPSATCSRSQRRRSRESTCWAGDGQTARDGHPRRAQDPKGGEAGKVRAGLAMGKLHEMAIRDVLKIPKEAKPGKYVL